MKIKYAKYHEQVSQVFDRVKELIRDANITNGDKIQEKIDDGFEKFNSDSNLRIVLIGEFSVGKTSIISALTGKKLEIDPDVTTNVVSEHTWGGVTLVDTPGVLSEPTATSHDEMSIADTIKADLVLYVITPELFGPNVIKHLNYVIGADGLALNRKTAIVINKIDRENNKMDVIVEEISKVLGVNSNIPMYYCAARKYIQSWDVSSDLKERLVTQSRIHELSQGINQFAKDVGKYGQLSTPLSVIESSLDELQYAISDTDEERDRRELIRRQRVQIQRLQKRIAELTRDYKERVYSAIVKETSDSLEEITENSTQEDIITIFELGIKSSESKVEQIHTDLIAEIRDAILETNEELNKFGESPLGKRVFSYQSKKAKKTNVSTGDDDGFAISSNSVKIARDVSKPLEEILKSAASNTAGIRDILYKTGKTIFNSKYKPHQVMNKAKWIGNISSKFSKSLPFISVGLDMLAGYLEEKEKEKKERSLATVRLKVREAFVEQARFEEQAIEETTNSISRENVQSCLDELDKIDNEISAVYKNNDKINSVIVEIRKTCERMRNDIYSGEHF